MPRIAASRGPPFRHRNRDGAKRLPFAPRASNLDEKETQDLAGHVEDPLVDQASRKTMIGYPPGLEDIVLGHAV